MNSISASANRQRGFTLVELMIVIAVAASLVSIAVPSYTTYVVRAKVSEGLNVMAGPKARIASFEASEGRLPANFAEMGLPGATGSAHGGDAASFRHVFGYDSEIWRQVEWQPKSGGWILVLRSKRKPEWDNVDIGLHLQVKADGDAVQFRCIVNSRPTRQQWVPASCRHGGVEDWNW